MLGLSLQQAGGYTAFIAEGFLVCTPKCSLRLQTEKRVKQATQCYSVLQVLLQIISV